MEPRKAGRPPNGSPFKGIYMLTGIPPDLWARVEAKAATYRPPLSKRWVLLQLLEKWAPAPKRIRRAKAEPVALSGVIERPAAAEPFAVVRPALLKPIPKPSAPPIDAPDLGESF